MEIPITERKNSGGHTPGPGYKRNFNRNPTGRFHIHMRRGATSRSKSR